MISSSDNGSFHLKPNKHETYDGRHDYLTVSTWLFILEQYLCLTLIVSSDVPLPDSRKILFASSYIEGPATVWWFNAVTAGNVQASWE